MRLRRIIWRWLRPPQTTPPRTALRGEAHTLAATRAWVIVRALYAFNFALAVGLAQEWERWNYVPTLDPLWPVHWLDTVGVAHGATALLVGHLGSSLLVLLHPQSRASRIACLAFALPAFALQNSLGKINHGYHGLLWVLALFIFLPNSNLRSMGRHGLRCFQQRTLRIFWAAQAALLMFYSMSGALKLYASLGQLVRGQVSFLSPSGAAHHIAHRLLQTQTDSLLGPFIIEHSWLGGPTQWLTLYLESLALVIAFRPALHRLWCAGLLAMHVGIGLTMNIWFTNHMFVIALMLGCSPFTRDGTSFSEALKVLPGMATARACLSHLGTWRRAPS